MEYFLGVVAVTGGVCTGCVVPFEGVVSFAGIFCTGCVVFFVDVVVGTEAGRLVGGAAFIVMEAVCVSSDGNKCGVSRKEHRTNELSGCMLYPVSPVLMM